MCFKPVFLKFYIPEIVFAVFLKRGMKNIRCKSKDANQGQVGVPWAVSERQGAQSRADGEASALC